MSAAAIVSYGSIAVALALVYALALAIRDPDIPQGTLWPLKARPIQLVQLTPGKHPKLFSIARAIDVPFVTESVARVVTLVESVERDALVCVPGARRLTDGEKNASVMILPAAFGGEVAVSAAAGGGGPTTELRNKLVEAALAERSAIVRYASQRLLETSDPLTHVRLHEAHAELDRVLISLIKRLGVACDAQKARLGLQYAFKYNGVYSTEFVSTDQALGT